MSRRLFGKTAAVIAAIIATACVSKVPGNPEAVAEKYVKAVQAGDFDTIFAINAQTARQKKYLSASESATRAEDLKAAIELNRKNYLSVEPTFTPGIRWAERFYFPASSVATVGTAHWYQPVGTDPSNLDPVNAEYVKSTTILVPVSVTYTRQEEALQYQEKKVRSARYDCVFSKIREGKNVAIYSHDENWYFAGCVVDQESIQPF